MFGIMQVMKIAINKKFNQVFDIYYVPLGYYAIKL